MPEAIPELIYVAAFLAALLGYLAARGLLFAWGHTLGLLLSKLAEVVNFSFTILGHTIGYDFGKYLEDVNHAVITGLQTWADGAEIQMGYCLHGMTKVIQYTAEAVDYLAGETAKGFEWTIRVKIPKFLKQFVTIGSLGLIVARLIQQAIRGIHSHTVKVAGATVYRFPITVKNYITKAAAGAVAIPKWVLHIPRELTGLEKDVGRIHLRVNRLWALLGVAGMAAAMANVFGIPNWRCLTRGGVGKTMRALCGLPTHLLDDFLALLADFFVLSNICEVVKLLEPVFQEVAVPLVKVLTEGEKAVCWDPKSEPGALPHIPLYLPSVVPSLTAGV